MANLLDPVVFFSNLGDYEFSNNSKRIAMAVRCGYEGVGTANLYVFQKNVQGLAENIEHAETINEALEGYKWATVAEAESWGIDLNDPNQDITSLETPQ